MEQLPPEVQAQLEEQKKSCIFCKIISGEMSTNKVYEDDLIVACLDINPATKGHILLMPKEHYPIMPYIPAKTFSHMFGIIPKLVKADCSALARTGAIVYVANGAAAGQQSAHFLLHLLPREKMDGIGLYSMAGKIQQNDEILKMLSHNLPLMMKNHFGRNPAEWHKGIGETPDFLSEIRSSHTLIYEDEKVLCVAAKNALVAGHLILYSKEEEKDITQLSKESGSHLFFAASFAATAIFEGMKPQATNIILKSGTMDDNPENRMSVHMLPRSFEDGLNLMWEPKQGSGLEEVAKSISGKTIFIGKEEAKQMQTIEFSKPEVIRAEPESQLKQEQQEEQNQGPLSPLDEIQRAIRRFQQ